MGTARCKYCGDRNVTWARSSGTSSWMLCDFKTRQPHVCKEGTYLLVACKYCKADNLHWEEHALPNGKKKAFLTESYGLPHGCDEKTQFWAKKNEVRNKQYAVVKENLASIPDGKCPACKGTKLSLQNGCMGLCHVCFGVGKLDSEKRKVILYRARKEIWPEVFTQ